MECDFCEGAEAHNLNKSHECWLEISGGGKVGDEFSGLDNVMNSVLEAVAPRPSNIIPGTQTFEDLEAFLKRKKSEKLEEMKKNLWTSVENDY